MPQESQLERRLADALADRLRALRAAAGLTQEQVAHQAGMNRNHYQLLESGLSDRTKRTPANPRLSTLVALCDVYGTSVPAFVIDIFQNRPGGITIEVPEPRRSH
ncbi:helix-turn-helix domain-containing protein [Luteimicrobium album]|nr:helix-turn-helix transcriptional regulator [Luteimicrobium album]